MADIAAAAEAVAADSLDVAAAVILFTSRLENALSLGERLL